MNEEYRALMKNSTWELVPIPPNKKIVGSKWIFKVKKNSYGSITRYKARLVAQGFHQTADIDYSETYNPVIKPITIRVILTVSLAHNW